jgi:excinuclease ABC subunit A
MASSDIIIRGAREHNLRNVNLRIPRNRLICMTGVSGSGKSSLAFDTLYAEGQRRYVESLSSYARQFLGQMPKPEVDSVTGLAPSISIQQKAGGRNPRSTVGTITEIYDYLRVLLARVGTGFCAKCGRQITAQTVEQIIEHVARIPAGTRMQLLAPVIQQQKGEYQDLFDDLRRQGFLRARVDGRLVQLADNLRLDRQMRHTIEVVVDRLVAGSVSRTRLTDSIETALKLSGGTLVVTREAAAESAAAQRAARAGKENKESGGADGTTETRYSSHYACMHCGISYEPPSPQLFSFNSPQGMCTRCNGLGMRHDFLLDRLIPDDSRTLWQGAVDVLGPIGKIGRWRRHIYKGVANSIEKDVGLPKETLLKTPWRDLPEAAQKQFLYGTGDRHITFAWRSPGGVWKHGGTYDGLVADLLESYRKAKNVMRRRQLEKYMEFVPCTECGGTRLNAQARSVRITSSSERYAAAGKPASLSLPEVCALSIAEAFAYFESLDLDETRQMIAAEALKEIRGRLGFLLRCGLDYLTLDRSAPTLSGGESQRIRLAAQIGCGLVGVVYILDEPSIGLHARDNALLLDSLKNLRDQGNTVIVVEHDEETMREADHIVDFGPGPGVRGGEIVAEGTLDDLRKEPKSLTGRYLSGELSIAVPEKRRPRGKKALKIVGARHHNLRNVDAVFPLETFLCVTGVSGSGKSSLINDILWEALNRDLNKGKGQPGTHTRINGLDHLDKAINIDQSPIGRTPRSNPATYVKLFDLIRDLFAQLPESKMRGFKPGRFSFNVSGGRCEACEGRGANRLEMDFLADVWVTCPVCQGHRFTRETLEVRYKGSSIADILEMDVQEALEHFKNIPPIASLLQTLHDVGLDYIKLGQPSPTLSGGEAQRIKLARELGKRSTGRTLYLLDEPTTGLHFADIHKLLEVLHGFVDAGNTVIVVEHNLDVLKTADWIIDLGPEGGSGGGRIVVEGTPEEVAACAESYTGESLRTVLPGYANGVTVSPARGVKEKGSAGSRSKRKQTAGITARSIPAGRWQFADEGRFSGQTDGNGQGSGSSNMIVIRGAAQHNLQHVDVDVPREKMSVFCGPSGSGKSSLAMDTLYAEGQRRYVESLSAYARQFLGQMPKPRVEHIHGLSPAIAIEQKAAGHSPRSTVGTVTEIYDYLRILYARLGTLYCPECGIPVETQTSDQIVDKILALPAASRLILLAPQEVTVGQSYDTLWQRVQLQGFLRVRIDGTTYRLEDVPQIDRRRKHAVEIVVDRIAVDPKARSRIAGSVETALDLGRGAIFVARADEALPEEEWIVDRYSLHFACHQCGRSFEELTPNSFSFNSPLGWCPACEGLGTEQGTNLTALIADSKRTLREGAIAAWPNPAKNALFAHMLEAWARQLKVPLDVPFERLDPAQQRLVLHGSGDRWIAYGKKGEWKFQYKGLFPAIEEASRVSYAYRQRLHELVGEVPCSWCGGSRLRADAASVRFLDQTIHQLCSLPLGESLTFLKAVQLSTAHRKIAGDLLNEATNRLSFLVDVGLEYLTLARPLPTLSGGETQRIRLAGQIGRALTGVLYVLDEPTIGLHPRDNDRLLEALRRLRDLGNTLVLVEHDREVLIAADRLYDFGPGAGRFGGSITAQGTPKELSRASASLTGQYLSGRKEIPIPNARRMKAGGDDVPPGGGWIELLGARQHNLHDVDLRLPLGTFTCVTGVSGSGKSSLIEDTLARAVAKRLNRASDPPGPHAEIRGLEQINKVIVVDQQPLGNTPASNPATYTGVFDSIRELFARLPEARVRGYQPARFSFNRPGGRCDDCEGNGQKCIQMHFLPDVWVECETCHGKRYNRETLGVTYRGRSIADVLELPIGQAQELFENIPRIRRYLATLCAIGLDYLTLGQPAPTLSGGEAQRVKLAAELARPDTGKTLYILDEPTTGLHFDDIDKLLKVLNSLVEQGNTVVVIEHNLDVIKTADWIVDLGPEAGDDGGRIVAAGTPEEVVAQAQKVRKTNGRRERPPLRSYTAEMLAPVLAAGARAERQLFSAAEAEKKRAGDIELRQVGRDAKMPWQTDGRRWHTVDRVARNGKACRWEGSALAHVVDAIEARPGFLPANWNERSVVEITGENRTGVWFLHALTGDEWLLTLKFRVPKRTFDEESLRGELDLKSLDDLDELPIYGRSERVRIRNVKGPWQEVTVTVHWLREIDTPEFARFLTRAGDAFQAEVNREKLNPADLTPWKVLGRKWHLSRKGFPSSKRIRWEPELLERLLDLLQSVGPQVEIDWGNKQVVYFRSQATQEVWAAVHTKRRHGVDLSLFNEAGRIALGRIAELGSEREIAAHRNGRDQIGIRFDKPEQLANKSLAAFLKEHAGF